MPGKYVCFFSPGVENRNWGGRNERCGLDIADCGISKSCLGQLHDWTSHSAHYIGGRSVQIADATWRVPEA